MRHWPKLKIITANIAFPDTKLGLEERELGGLGIHLVKNIMDEYQYKRSKGENIIVLVKSKSSTYTEDVLKTKPK